MNKILNVYLLSDFVGKLIQNEHGAIRFKYSTEWLAQHTAHALSQCLPLREKAFSYRECRGFFAGILPDEANRKIIAQILGISSANDHAMLEQIGGECAGAITFLPENEAFPVLNESEVAYKELSNEQILGLIKTLATRPLLAGEEGVRISLAGAQNKIAVRVQERGRISIPLGSAPSTHILKPAAARFPRIVQNEELCLRLAKAIGIEAAEATSAKVEDSEYLLVKRYDRITQDGRMSADSERPHPNIPQRLHQEDFCQALNHPPERKYQSEGGPSLKTCFSIIRSASTVPARDIQHLINVIIFNIIVGNNDAHGKNFSLLYVAGQTRLAPVYDIVSTMYYPELSQRMAMKIGKQYESSKLSLKDFEQFATDCSLNFPLLKKRIVEVAAKTSGELEKLKAEYPQIPNLVQRILAQAERLRRLCTSS